MNVDEISEKVNKYLHSEDFFEWMEEKVLPYIKPHIEKFAKENADKAQEYINDPEKLEKDFEQFVGITNKVEWILNIVDIAIIGQLLIATLTTLIPSGGTSLIAFFTSMGARQLIKQGIKKAAKVVISRLIKKLSLRAFKKFAISNGIKIGGAFAREFIFRYTLYNALQIVSSGVKVGGAGALLAAQHILGKYGTELGMPNQLLQILMNVEITPEYFLDIVEQEISNNKLYLEEMLTLQGMQHLSIGAVARLLGINSSRRLLYFSENFKNLNQGINNQTVSVKGLRRALENNQQRLQGYFSENDISEQEILSIIQREKVLEFLIPIYQKSLKQIAAHENTKERQIKAIEKAIEQKRMIYPILEESFTEFATLAFLEKYQEYFDQHREEMEELLRDAINLDIVSIEELMRQSKAQNFAQLLSMLKESKTLEITGLIDRLTFGNTNHKEKSTIFQQFREIYNVDKYISSLYQLIFNKVDL